MKYQIHKGSKYYGATTVFENIQFEIRNTEKIAIVGRNGCGKTTLLSNAQSPPYLLRVPHWSLEKSRLLRQFFLHRSKF